TPPGLVPHLPRPGVRVHWVLTPEPPGGLVEPVRAAGRPASVPVPANGSRRTRHKYVQGQESDRGNSRGLGLPTAVAEFGRLKLDWLPSKRVMNPSAETANRAGRWNPLGTRRDSRRSVVGP